MSSKRRLSPRATKHIEREFSSSVTLYERIGDHEMTREGVQSYGQVDLDRSAMVMALVLEGEELGVLTVLGVERDADRGGDHHVVAFDREVHAEKVLDPVCDVDRTAVRGDDAQAFEKGDRHLVIYLDGLPAGEQRSFEIPFTPRHALDVRTAPSRVYEYYVPEETVVLAPVRVRAD